ncbi:MAG: polyketide cyclase [Alistipes sp.]|nr:polyketide cyclase [Alistipes sp.]MBQ1958417.1 polyketide cyclase [Alistipes sp.]MBQ1981585.1 polyketide cyclase [Alistipes sp.]MBQ2416225.1 polyketide cyclase [Alistipes sp.]MBQ5623546.1 polyketide cyclase [Alistipes sp.]
MEKYESKQQQIFKPAARIFPFISRFDMLTPALQDKVEEWSATEDTCSFKVKGFTVALRIVERVENKHIKISGDEGAGVPVDFSFWIQLHEVSESDTRIRMVLHAELNMMMRMMIGSKIQGGLDKAVEGLAQAFNQLP